jgi:hypothetical protein
MQVKSIIDAYPGNLNAAEAACEELADTDDTTPSPTLSTSTVRRGKKAQEGDILKSLEQKVHESGEVLKCLSQSQPINECTAFANYVHDSLLSMNKRKFKKVRSAINRVLTQAMDENSEDEDEVQTRSNMQPIVPPIHSGRPVTTTAFPSPSPSEMYQPPPHMWRHRPPPASVWASATQEYVEQYNQQPLQPRQEQTVMTSHPSEFQHTVHQQNSVSAVLGPAAQVLDQSNDLSEL